jgi:metallo-beta-lactamase class B
MISIIFKGKSGNSVEIYVANIMPLPELNPTTNLNIGNVKIETYYPGEGHTQDNIVVWFPDSKVLFAGCSVKSIDTKNLGNLADANVKEWPNSLKNILKKYPGILIVIPGHGNWGDINLINHTLKLFN